MVRFALLFNDPWVFWSIVVFIGSFAVWAICWPQRFSSLAQSSSSWVDSSKALAVLDRRVEVDHFILRNSRTFGVVLLVGLALYVGLVTFL
jgi:uncharacterized membrane protein